MISYVLLSLVIVQVSCGYVESLHSSICTFPPSLWCSSRKIAEQCQVVKQCEDFVWQPVVREESVKFALYYESLCQDCKQFITRQLLPTYAVISDIMDLELVPFGNAEETKVGDKWNFTCQHGPDECLGNLVETCSLNVLEKRQAFKFIFCIETSSFGIKKAVERCARDQMVDLPQVMRCVDGPLGNQLEHEMAVKTAQLFPPHDRVPWVTLNGEHSEEIEERAEKNLLRLICDTYQGRPIPKACQRLLHAS